MYYDLMDHLTKQAVGGLIALSMVPIGCGAMNYMTFGSLWRHSQVDILQPKRIVRSWNEQGLLLDDGRRVLPAGMTALPARSDALTAITKRGVQVDADGQVFGLLSLFHTCGNDPVGYDLRKINVAHFLLFYGEGTGTVRFLRSDMIPVYHGPGPSGNDWSTANLAAMKVSFDFANAPESPGFQKPSSDSHGEAQPPPPIGSR